MSFNSPPATERPHGYEENNKTWFNVGDFDPKSYNLKMQKEEVSGQQSFLNENQSANTKSGQQKLDIGQQNMSA